MTDSATTRKRLRKQSLGSNVNTWGDTKLNEVLDALDQSIDGYLAIALTGSVTLTTTNYSTADQAKRRVHKFTGSLVGGVTVTYPSVEAWYFCINASGATVTVNTAAGTGIAIPNGRSALVFCDASDFYSMVPNYLPTATTLTNSQDLVSFAQLTAAIAAITAGSVSGLVLNSATATQANYLASLLSGSGAVSISTTNPGTASEKTNIAVGALGLTLQSMQTVNFTASAGKIYPVDMATVTTVTLPASATLGDSIGLAIGGIATLSISPNGLKINGSTNSLVVSGNQTLVITYWGASNGWV